MYPACTLCGTRWQSQLEFLCDSAIELIGYYPNFQDWPLSTQVLLRRISLSRSLQLKKAKKLDTQYIYEENQVNCELSETSPFFCISCHPSHGVWSNDYQPSPHHL